MDLLAVTYGGATRSALVTGLSKAGLRAPTGSRAYKGPEIEAILRELVVRGVVNSPSSHFVVADEVAHRAMLAVTRRGELDRLATASLAMRPPQVSYSQPVGSWDDGMRAARIALYAGRWDVARAAIARLGSAWPAIWRASAPEWVATFPDDLRSRAVVQVLHHAAFKLTRDAAAEALIEEIPTTAFSDNDHHGLVGHRVLQGRFDDARALLANRASVQAEVGRAWLLLLHGDAAGAARAYELALAAFLKEFGKRTVFFPDRGGLFFVVALLATGELERARTLATAASKPSVSGVCDGHRVLAWASEALAGRDVVDELDCPRPGEGWDPIDVLMHALAWRWQGLSPDRAVCLELAQRARRAEDAGLCWLATQYARCISAVDAQRGGVVEIRARAVPCDLTTLVRRAERWPGALAALEAVAKGSGGTAVAGARPEGDLRLIWVLNPSPHFLHLDPIEQVRSKGTWSKGRAVALKRLYDDAAGMAHLSTADRIAAGTITSTVSGRYGDVSYQLQSPLALRALIGQPNVFAREGDALVPVEVRRVEPRLRIEQRGEVVSVSLAPSPRDAQHAYSAHRAGPTAIEVVEFAPIHHAVAEVIGQKALEVPVAQAGRVRALVDALAAKIPVEGNTAPAGVPGDATPVVLLRRRGEGIAVELVVRPFGERGPSSRPGVGGAQVTAVIDGRAASVDRDLVEERRRASALVAECSTLASCGDPIQGVVITRVDLAIEVLVELTASGTTLVWPDGDPLVVHGPFDVDALHVALKKDKDAFIGHATLGRGDGALDVTRLLSYLEATPARFFATDQGFVALSEELRRRLGDLLALSSDASRLRYSAVRAPLVDELLAGAVVARDAAWRKVLARRTAVHAEVAVPPTLRAELRPYQLAGFRWLARLARWGIGGCLADDMGLGKTVQVIGLLLHRAHEGPSIVVAPTSLIGMWEAELARFAPTLSVRTLTGPDRAGVLDGLGPGDVVLTSYAIAVIDVAALSVVSFVVAVIDEAQAIKNPTTARAHAAFALEADQRVATTGTPIENRLTDLWSLYRFLAPGLLGFAADFERKFARPIERDRDPLARDRLRRLVAPLLLRRTKAEVLPELPPKTEIVLRIALSPEEAAIYEAIRADILDGLTRRAPGEPLRMALLAGITRLRRAASHSRMVMPSASATSSKLVALVELLDDIVPSGHKALVFSQFVDHLTLAREALDAVPLKSQYLDGSTPAAARQVAVEAFQRGEGDVFLISLKAGGTGLTLTAADYVVHLDPWWNPAAEDQASDRSHRIGQTRPVTVYRLVAADTIEDAILALHDRKRELAAGILSGADTTALFGVEELLTLIRGGPPVG